MGSQSFIKPVIYFTHNLKKLLGNIQNCSECCANLPVEPRPVVSAHPESKIVIIGQAPGIEVHETGIPWNDPSGNRLREWLDVDDKLFYDPSVFALIPMGFCYPGKGKSGDLPPRPECAPLWHKPLLNAMPRVQLKLLFGMYAQQYYLGKKKKRTLTDTVKNYSEYLPEFLPLPHPSPRNNIWLKKNPWFEKELLPSLRSLIKKILQL